MQLVDVKTSRLSYALSRPYLITASEIENVKIGIRKLAITSRSSFVLLSPGLILPVYKRVRSKISIFEPKLPMANITVLTARLLYLFIH